MYKVFVNDIPIILSSSKEIGANYKTFPLQTVRLKKIIKKINSGKLEFVHLFHETESEILEILFQKIKVVTAAGGMVVNSNKEILFIYRNGRWDLPKGKTEKDESIKDSAIREVEEETGVENLEITRFITKTYHIFKRNDKFKLKETYWYEMSTNFTGPLKPEKSEGIKKAKWKNFKKSQKALGKSYANIKMLFPDAYLAGESENWVA